MDTIEKFEAWLKSQGYHGVSAAKALGIHQSVVNGLRAGKRKPSLRVASLIERATLNWDDGPIFASEWSGVEFR